MRLNSLHIEDQLIAESLLSKTAATVAMLIAVFGGGKILHKMLQDRGIDPQEAQVLMADPEVQQEAERMRQQIQAQPEEPEQQPDNTVSEQDYVRFISQWEGRENTRYFDPGHVPTIGVGFNLQRRDAPRLLSAVGADYRAVLSGRQSLTDDQINALLAHDVRASLDEVRQRFPEFEEYPREVKLILVDFMFNLGEVRFDVFDDFALAIRQRNWQNAAYELGHNDEGGVSGYYNDTGQRAIHHIRTLESL